MEPDRQAHSTAHNEPYSDDARWMTFAEFALIRGTSKRAAVTLIRRHGWRRQRNNEGHVIALVPLTWATSEQDNKEPHKDAHKEAIGEPHNGAHAAGFETALAAIQVAHTHEVAALRERVDAAEESRIASQALADRIVGQLADASSRADHAEKRANAADADRRAAEARADRMEQAVAGERAQADKLRDRLEGAQEELRQARQGADQARQHAREAEDAIEALRRADEERKARGRWARIRAAWRGSRPP
jgi:hypothetical protein